MPELAIAGHRGTPDHHCAGRARQSGPDAVASPTARYRSHRTNSSSRISAFSTIVVSADEVQSNLGHSLKRRRRSNFPSTPETADTISYLEGFYSPALTRPSLCRLYPWFWVGPMQNHSLCFESFKDEMPCTVQFTCRIQPSPNAFRLAAPRSGAGPTLLPFPGPSNSRWAVHAGVSLRLKRGRRHETRGAVDVSRVWT